MKVIGSGFGRTGTLSMKHALEELGFDPCYHMEEVFKNPPHIKLWYEITIGKDKNWDALLGEYQACVDFPTSMYYKDLIEKYPDAKVIHTVRDPERWYDSTSETIYPLSRIFPSWLRAIVRPIGQFSVMSDMIWTRLFDDRFEDRDYAIKKFNEYTEDVKRTVPAERLLVFEVKEGWGPLCEFLGVPVPDMPFPHVNDRQEMLKRLHKISLGVRLAPFVIALVLIAVFVLLTVIF